MMLSARTDLDTAQKNFEHYIQEEARAENEYRKARANAYLASSGTVNEREAHVDKACEAERMKAHLAEGMAKASLESVRNKRQELSMLQSIGNAVKEEIAMARYGSET